MSESLEILSATEAFMDFCDPQETGHLEAYFAEAGPVFIAWLQEKLSKAMNEDWDPSSFLRRKFGDMVLRSKRDGAAYRVRVTVSVPDPFIVDQFDGYPVTVSFEKRKLTFQEPALRISSCVGNAVAREVRGLEALLESDHETSSG